MEISYIYNKRFEKVDKFNITILNSMILSWSRFIYDKSCPKYTAEKTR